MPRRSIPKAAKKSGITQGYISRVLNGKRNPRLETAKKIARGLGVTLEGLYRLIEENSSRGVDPTVSARIAAGLKAKKQKVA